MHKIKKITVTLTDDTELSYEGKGVCHEVRTQVTTESWEGLPEDAAKPETTTSPLTYIYIQMKPE